MDFHEVKLLAFHLPQFHMIPENDKWWGKGFTEWTNTRKAKPLYKGHNQPREPFNDKYYDLSKQEDITWEMKLANEYGLDGFCYYHYWFDGKLLLQKPLEIMRELPERIPYCFCWANEPWIRSWEGSKKVLMEQRYNGFTDWKAHFNYFLNFFTDEKYIKVQGKPVLVLYKAISIDQHDEMINYWDKRCKEAGFEGIYIIEEKNGFQEEIACGNSDAYLEFEPLYTTRFRRGVYEKILDYLIRKIFNMAHHTNCLVYSYDRIWNNILCRKHEIRNDCVLCLGAFVDWDNTARKGINSTFFYGVTPDKFESYIKKQIDLAKKLGAPFIFINAWNEWGEGTYLEPDKKNGYKYLYALKNALKR